MSGLGYREFQPYVHGDSSLAEAIQRLKFDTHAFARRQPAWFRRLPNLTTLPVPASSSDLVEQARQLVKIAE
jgi:tRNA dimethylallyltransferase